MQKIILFLIGLTFILNLSLIGHAHEVRPAYLEIKETETLSYKIFWKVPERGGNPLDINPEFSAECQIKDKISYIRSANYDNYRWYLKCSKSLKGTIVKLKGLENTTIETIARINHLDGVSETNRIYRGNNSFTIAEDSNFFNVAKTYIFLGIDHILLGFDHLCFVLALLLLIKNHHRLLWAITAFTLGHSITLGGAVLGFLNAPSQPIEAFIAFSIVMVAAEIISQQRNHVSIIVQKPWLITCTFGLLHGFGFAGALSETGLPQDAIPTALLFFNIGIEFGQIFFIIFVLTLIKLIEKFIPKMYPTINLSLTYAIGIIAAFWTIERVVGFL